MLSVLVPFFVVAIAVAGWYIIDSPQAATFYLFVISMAAWLLGAYIGVHTGFSAGWVMGSLFGAALYRENHGGPKSLW